MVSLKELGNQPSEFILSDGGELTTNLLSLVRVKALGVCYIRVVSTHQPLFMVDLESGKLSRSMVGRYGFTDKPQFETGFMMREVHSILVKLNTRGYLKKLPSMPRQSRKIIL